MRHTVSTALVGALALSLLAAPAHAAPRTDTGRDDDTTPTRTVGLDLSTDEATLERALAALAAADTPAEAQTALEDTLGTAAVDALAKEVGAPADALFGEEARTMKKRSFMQCMRARVGDDIRSILDVNAVAAYLGKEKYVEAAKAAVEYLAKQGVKRNVAGLATTLAFCAAKCRLFG